MIKRNCRHQFNVTHVEYDYSRRSTKIRWVDNEWLGMRRDFYKVYAICQKCKGEGEDDAFIGRMDREEVIMGIDGWKMMWKHHEALGHYSKAEYRSNHIEEI